MKARALDARWGEIEVQGESYRRDAVRRLFEQLELVEGGVTQQTAHLAAEPSNQYDTNAVKVVVKGWHIGYVPNEIAAEVAAAVGEGEGVVPVRIWADPRDGTWRARATLFPALAEPDRNFSSERRRTVSDSDEPETITPQTLDVTDEMDLTSLAATRMRVKGTGQYVGWKERRLVGGTEYVLVREPDNAHDAHAVLVLSQSRKVGYVSAARARMLAPLLDILGAAGYVISGAGPTEDSVQLWIDIPKVDTLRSFVKSR